MPRIRRDTASTIMCCIILKICQVITHKLPLCVVDLKQRKQTFFKEFFLFWGAISSSGKCAKETVISSMGDARYSALPLPFIEWIHNCIVPIHARTRMSGVPQNFRELSVTQFCSGIAFPKIDWGPHSGRIQRRNKHTRSKLYESTGVSWDTIFYSGPWNYRVIRT